MEQLQSQDEVAVEAMGTTARFHDAVVGRVARGGGGQPAPVQGKVISESVKKTDRNDAQALALYLAKHLLPEVRVKPKQNRELLHLAETRDLLVKQRSALKGKINNLLAMQAIELKREALSSKIALERVMASPVQGMVQLELLVGQIRSLSESIAELEERLEEEGQQLPGYENLTSIKGIGSFSATVLLTVISDFRDENKLAAYHLGCLTRPKQFLSRHYSWEHSLWPGFREVPSGWTAVGPKGRRQECLDWIEANWTDMRPRSLVQAMNSAE